MIERSGRTFCLYAGLLDEAHQQGLQEIRTTLIQIPTPDNGNVAICQSEVRTEKGVFTGLGDASPQNVARAMQTCLVRMAETRAKARALRDAVNVGVVALEELDPEASNGDGDEHPGPGNGNGSRVPARFAEPGPSNGYPARSERPAPQPAAARPVVREAGRAPEPRSAPAPVSVARPAPARAEAPSFESERPSGNDGMTAAQRRMLESLAQQLGEELELDDLSRREASQKISELKGRLTQSRAA